MFLDLIQSHNKLKNRTKVERNNLFYLYKKADFLPKQIQMAVNFVHISLEAGVVFI